MSMGEVLLIVMLSGFAWIGVIGIVDLLISGKGGE